MNWFKSFWKGLNTPLVHEHRESVEVCINFSPRAQQVLALAYKEAQRLGHSFIGTEHLLLGVISLGQGTAVTVLRKMGLDLETVRLEIKKQVGMGTKVTLGPIPYTPRVKKVFTLAAKEAKALNHTYIGTEHLLLGLLREGDNVAARVLSNLGLDTEATRQHILRELDPNYSRMPDDTAMPQGPQPPKSQHAPLDVSKRYDVYCREGDQEVVYRNALLQRRQNVAAKTRVPGLV